MEKLTKYMNILLLLVLVASCKSSFTADERAKLVTLKQQIEKKAFEFNASTVIPFNTQALNNVAGELLLRNGNSTARINVQGDHYTMKIANEEATFNLPFFGERRFNSNYNNDAGFNYKSAIKDVGIKINDKDRYITYKFTASNSTETLQVELQIYNMNTAKLNLNSSHRTFIKYDGYLAWVVNEDAKER
jgi:hypothetical protein